MASTARHRAATPLAWTARSLVTATTVPVGALAGCVVAAVAASAQHPGVGFAGYAAAGVPLTFKEVRARLAARRAERLRARHLAAPAALAPVVELVRLDPAVDVLAPSPAAARALSLVPVAPASPRAEAAEAVVVAIPAPRAASEVEVEVVEVRAEVVVHVGAAQDDLTVSIGVPASAVAPEQRAAEIAQLNRLWASGTGPDTGSLRAASAA